MNFIESQSKLHMEAAQVLNSIQIQLELLKEIENKPFYQEHINKKLDKLYLKYHDIIKGLISPIMRQDEYIGNVLTIA